MGVTEILILTGGFVGGYVSGLTGFGTGLTALPFLALRSSTCGGSPAGCDLLHCCADSNTALDLACD